jgi:hypothetical protein
MIKATNVTFTTNSPRASLAIDCTGLSLVTYNGKPMMLAYGDGARTREAICQLYEEVNGTPPLAPEDPYFRGFQAIGGYQPHVGDKWQLADERARQMMIMDPDPEIDGVRAQWVRFIGYHGAPAFFPEVLPAAALDGARPWE